MIKVNKWTLGLAAAGLVTLPSAMQGEERPNQLQTALSSTTISGYVDTSIHWTLGSGNANPPKYSFNGPSKQDGFNLNVVNIVLERPLDESTWSAGYKVDLLFGPNAVGFNSSIGSSSSDFGIKQAYVALRAPVGNGIDFKLGVWDTIIGYEVFNSGSNPNYTRSYGYTLEPTQHTGLLASYQINKVVGVSAGIANTHSAGINSRALYDSGSQAETEKSFMGALTITAPEDWGAIAGSAFYLGVVDGWNSGFGPATGDDVTSYYAGITLNTGIKGFKVGAAFDYMDTSGNNRAAEITAWIAGLYASLQMTEKLSWHNRAEYGDLEDTGIVPGKVFALTSTLQYDLWANILSRLELRWDRSLDGGAYGGESSGFSGNKRNEILVAGNLIYKF